MVKVLFGLDVNESDFACDSIVFNYKELPEYHNLPKEVLGHSLAIYDNNEFKVLIQIVTDMDTSKILVCKAQKFL